MSHKQCYEKRKVLDDGIARLTAQLDLSAAVVSAAIEYRDNAGFQHAWNCNSGVPGIGTRPCDCGADELYKALAAKMKSEGV